MYSRAKNTNTSSTATRLNTSENLNVNESRRKTRKTSNTSEINWRANPEVPSNIDWPALSTRWLEPDDIRFLEPGQMSRWIHSHGEYKEKSTNWTSLLVVVRDWNTILLIFANWSNAVPNYALNFTMPQIIHNMGFVASDAQLLTIPAYACGAIWAYAFAVCADRFRWTMPFIIGPQICLVVSFANLFAKSADVKNNLALCYFAVCLSCFGMYPILPGVNAWNIANLPDPTKRAVGIGYLVCVGNIGGLIGSYIYIEEEKPRYPTRFGSSIAFAAAGIVAALLLEGLLWRINKKRSSVSEEEIRAQHSDDDLARMGEESPLFKYAL